MVTDKWFKLTKPTVALDLVGTKRAAVLVPEGAALKAKAVSTDASGMIDVLWEGRTVAMFAIDLNERALEVIDLQGDV